MRIDDVRKINQDGWDRRVEEGDVWTRPVSSEDIARARSGDWSVVLTPNRPVPRAWFGDLTGRDLLCLLSGGGQQGPILAAAGARVTVLDASPMQLAQDDLVARGEHLNLKTVQGFMDDMSSFADGAFDLIVHPVSNNYTPSVEPVWRECFRVLKRKGALLAGFMDPIVYVFDPEAEERGELIATRPLPYADIDALGPEELQRVIARDHTVEYSHTLEAQIGGQLEAGFLLTHFFDDRDRDADNLRSRLFPTCYATRALKP